jgi:hypothetical protein
MEWSSVYDFLRRDTTMFSSRAEMLQDIRQLPSPKALRLLRPALKALSVAVAQVNMLHGDLAAHLAFELLWNGGDCGNPAARFATKAEIDADTRAERKVAHLLVQRNPYVAKNVAMIALDRCVKLVGAGQDLAYAYALQHMVATPSTTDEVLSRSV